MADIIFYVLLAMIGIYGIWLTFRNVFKLKICVICATVVTSWVGLLTLKLLGYSINQTIVAILMGQSITGLMYFLERNSKYNRKLLLMKPFVILFGTLIAYWIISGVYK